jgi:hypothetical protein
MEEEDNIIVRWAQEDVETSYNLLNNNTRRLNTAATLHISNAEENLGMTLALSK